MTTVTAPLPAAQLLTPEEVSLRCDRGEVDGVFVDTIATHEGGTDGRWVSAEIDWRTIRLGSRATWDEMHPGVEPTAEAMHAVVEEAEGELLDLVRDHAETGCEICDGRI